jgi:hypothetical protein
MPDAHMTQYAIEIPNWLKQQGLYLTTKKWPEPNSHVSNFTIPLQQLHLRLTQEQSIQPALDTLVFHPLTASGLTPDARKSALDGAVLNHYRLWYYAGRRNNRNRASISVMPCCKWLCGPGLLPTRPCPTTEGLWPPVYLWGRRVGSRPSFPSPQPRLPGERHGPASETLIGRKTSGVCVTVLGASPIDGRIENGEPQGPIEPASEMQRPLAAIVYAFAHVGIMVTMMDDGDYAQTTKLASIRSRRP